MIRVSSEVGWKQANSWHVINLSLIARQFDEFGFLLYLCLENQIRVHVSFDIFINDLMES